MTGMGGGVILKPTLDLLQRFDAATVNALSSATVFAMSVVTFSRYLLSRDRSDPKRAFSLAAGSVAGGILGGALYKALLQSAGGEFSTLFQNAMLAAAIAATLIYMPPHERIPSLRCRGFVATAAVGAVMGAVSAFLGIGGGPINVAIIIFAFSVSAKEAAVMSLISIFFAQLSKMGTLLTSGDLFLGNLLPLGALILGAVLGGLAGSTLCKKLRDIHVARAFTAVQVTVILLCVYNIFTAYR